MIINTAGSLTISPLPLEEVSACREIGIPRVLNMYEKLSFWFTFFTGSLGFRKSFFLHAGSWAIFDAGFRDDAIRIRRCHPARLAHGHIQSLLDMGV